MSYNKPFKSIKYFLKALFYTKIKFYDKVLFNYLKSVKNNLDPFPKRINYNQRIADITDVILTQKNVNITSISVKPYPTKILILNSEISDSGGHTEIALRYIQCFHKKYSIDFYLTNVFQRKDENEAPTKSSLIKMLVNNYYKSLNSCSLDEKIFELYNYIIDNKITTINVNMHMEDVVGCAVLYLIKKYTDINIIFWNHADHFYSLGTIYANKIVSRCKNGKPITPNLKNYNNVLQLPFLIDEEPNNFRNDENLNNIKRELNIPEHAFITLTGCSLGKLNEAYFKLINQILNSNNNIYHIYVTTMSPKKKKKLYKKYKLNSQRFIIADNTPYFDNYINLSNVYIDSFPQGSALTLVDCIKYSKPVVIKINVSEPTKSFEEYLYDGYELAFPTAEGMMSGISKIANNSSFYKFIQNKVHEHFLSVYSCKNNISKYEELII